jgi:hypothetical protein
LGKVLAEAGQQVGRLSVRGFSDPVNFNVKSSDLVDIWMGIYPEKYEAKAPGKEEEVDRQHTFKACVAFS